MEESTIGYFENVTDYEYDFVFDDYDQHIVVAIAFLIAAILGLFGNCLVIISVFVSKKLRTVTNAFVVNLSIADLLTSLMIPFNVVVLLSHDEYPMKDWGCGVVAGVLFTCIGTSLFTLASIALNRLLLITRPMKTYKIVYSPFYTGIWIASTWIIPLCINIIPPLAGVGELGTSQKYRMCVHKSKHPLKETYDYIQVIGLFPIPLVVLIVSYVWIYIHLRRHTNKLIKHGYRDRRASLNMSESGTGTLTSTIQSSSVTPNNGNNNISIISSPTITIREKQIKSAKKKRMHRKRDNKITKNMFLVFIAFIVCFVPTAVQLFSDDFKEIVPYATALLLINACVNPIIYGFKHPYFNEVFRDLLTCRYDRIPEKSEGFKNLRHVCCCD